MENSTVYMERNKGRMEKIYGRQQKRTKRIMGWGFAMFGKPLNVIKECLRFAGKSKNLLQKQ